MKNLFYISSKLVAKFLIKSAKMVFFESIILCLHGYTNTVLILHLCLYLTLNKVRFFYPFYLMHFNIKSLRMEKNSFQMLNTLLIVDLKTKPLKRHVYVLTLSR